MTVILALPRVILAIIIGFVIAEPLLLRAFEHEVTAQAHVDRQEQLATGQRALDKQYADIPQLEAKQASLEKTLTGADATVYAGNPDYEQAKAVAHEAQNALAKAQLAAGCEAGGTCGTRRAGCGPVCEAKLRVVAQRRRVARKADRDLNEVQARLRNDAAHSEREAHAFATPELARVRNELSERRAERKRDHDQLVAAYSAPIGLLDREQALDRLTETWPVLEKTTWLFRSFLLGIDVMPILFKTLLSSGGPCPTSARRTSSMSASTGASRSRRTRRTRRTSSTPG